MNRYMVEGIARDVLNGNRVLLLVDTTREAAGPRRNHGEQA